jgi:hypothetical protein
MIDLLVLLLQLQPIITVHNDCLRPASHLTGLRVSSLPLRLTWFWFTNQSLLLLRLRSATVLRMSRSASESYVTTDAQSASLSWNKAPIWGLRPDFYYSLTNAGLLFGAPSLTRGWVCRLQWLLDLASAVIFGSESRGTRDQILLSQIRDFPFRRLLRLAGSRWRYSTPPPHGGSPWFVLLFTTPYIVYR